MRAAVLHQAGDVRIEEVPDARRRMRDGGLADRDPLNLLFKP